jgi:hypothetical protein
VSPEAVGYDQAWRALRSASEQHRKAYAAYPRDAEACRVALQRYNTARSQAKAAGLNDYAMRLATKPLPL